MNKSSFSFCVDSEIGTLSRLIIHSPDSGLGKVVPTKAQDWLFEDIVHLDTIRRKEYDYYVKILLFFLDYDKIYGKVQYHDALERKRAFYKPEKEAFHQSQQVIEFQLLLSDILHQESIRGQLIAAVCAIEKCTYTLQDELLRVSAIDLSKTLISGALPDGRMIFPPVPNLIFTRDIGVVIGDHILLSRPATGARARESLLGKYIFYNHPLFSPLKNRILELPDSVHSFLLPEGENEQNKTTLEGGDVMMIAPSHLLIGQSVRTSAYAVNQVIRMVFEQKLVRKVTVIRIPNKRAYMHIDTIFTQVRRDLWVLLGSLGRTGPAEHHQGMLKGLAESRPTERLHILQFQLGQESHPLHFAYLEDLLEDISRNDLCHDGPVQFIYSGGNEFPYDAREQWTDSCNLLALKEGVVLGYDRNNKTANGFLTKGFAVKTAEELIEGFESGRSHPDDILNTLILLPSAELSRARGGSHCMSLPLERVSLSGLSA